MTNNICNKLALIGFCLVEYEGGISMGYILYIQVLIDFVMKVLSYFKKNDQDDDEPKTTKKK